MAPSGPPPARASPILGDGCMDAPPPGGCSSGDDFGRIGDDGVAGGGHDRAAALSGDHPAGHRTRRGDARLEHLDLGVELLDALREVADLVAAGHAHPVESVGHGLVELAAPGAPELVGRALRALVLLPGLLASPSLVLPTPVDEAVEHLGALFAGGREGSEAG